MQEFASISVRFLRLGFSSNTFPQQKSYASVCEAKSPSINSPVPVLWVETPGHKTLRIRSWWSWCWMVMDGHGLKCFEVFLITPSMGEEYFNSPCWQCVFQLTFQPDWRIGPLWQVSKTVMASQVRPLRWIQLEVLFKLFYPNDKAFVWWVFLVALEEYVPFLRLSTDRRCSEWHIFSFSWNGSHGFCHCPVPCVEKS